MELVNIAWKLPEELFSENEYDEYSYACDVLDFEYGLFDKFNEEYPIWIKKYFKWKSKGVSL